MSCTDRLDYSIRLSEDEIDDNYQDDTLAKLSDGSGVYGSLGVFHSIHCIQRVRYLLHFDHYYSNQTERQIISLMNHGGKESRSVLY